MFERWKYSILPIDFRRKFYWRKKKFQNLMEWLLLSQRPKKILQFFVLFDEKIWLLSPISFKKYPACECCVPFFDSSISPSMIFLQFWRYRFTKSYQSGSISKEKDINRKKSRNSKLHNEWTVSYLKLILKTIQYHLLNFNFALKLTVFAPGATECGPFFYPDFITSFNFT